MFNTHIVPDLILQGALIPFHLKKQNLTICRYTDYAVVKATKDEVVLAVEEKIGEFAHWQQVHQVGLSC